MGEVLVVYQLTISIACTIFFQPHNQGFSPCYKVPVNWHVVDVSFMTGEDEYGFRSTHTTHQTRHVLLYLMDEQHPGTFYYVIHLHRPPITYNEIILTVDTIACHWYLQQLMLDWSVMGYFHLTACHLGCLSVSVAISDKYQASVSGESTKVLAITPTKYWSMICQWSVGEVTANYGTDCWPISCSDWLLRLNSA